MWNTNAPQGRIPCAIFPKFCRICNEFYNALAVKNLDGFAQGVTELGAFKLRGRVPQNFERPLAA